MTQRFAALALVAVLTASSARADDLSFTTNTPDDKDVITCSDVEMTYWKTSRGHDDIRTVRRDQTVSVRAPGSGPLRVAASENGGVWVQPSSDGSISAVICEAAGAESEREANAILDQLRIVNEGGELRVKGPSDHDWYTYIILSVPRGTSLDMSATNGPLELRVVQGTFHLETTNGPIGVSRVSGTVVARATNGPIKFRGHEGDMDLRAENGPVKVSLDATAWSGKGLDAYTSNGPITVVVPEGLQTGVKVESSSNSPWSWKAQANMSHDEDWEDGRSVQLGKGPVLVRVSTVNGPVSIKSPGGEGSGKSKNKSRI